MDLDETVDRHKFDLFAMFQIIQAFNCPSRVATDDMYYGYLNNKLMMFNATIASCKPTEQIKNLSSGSLVRAQKQLLKF